MRFGRFRRQPSLPPSVKIAPFWKRQPALALLLAVLLIVALARSRRAGGEDETLFHNHVFRVVHVADGDTFDIAAPDNREERTRVRLWGVDTPEIAGSPQGAMHFGAEASAFARETLLDQRVRILLNPERSRDRYGRLLAYVVLEDTGESFNELLLEHGMGYADWRYEHPLKSAYAQVERRARKERRGLWAAVQPADYPSWRRRPAGE